MEDPQWEVVNKIHPIYFSNFFVSQNIIGQKKISDI